MVKPYIALVAGAGLAVLAACAETVEVAVPTTVEIAAPATMLELGQTVRFTAAVLDRGGSPMNGIPVVWSSSAPAILRVSEDGAAEALRSGVATVTASADGVEGSVTVQVLPHAFAALGSASATSCALDREGRGYCWGYGQYGELGSSRGSPAWAPRRVEAPVTFRNVEGTESRFCAAARDGSGWCWGGSMHRPAAMPAMVASGPSLVHVSPLASGFCALSAEGSVHCAGYNGGGVLGRGSVEDRTMAYAPVDSPERFAQLSVGGTHSCALTADGRAFCWGWGINGELGVSEAPDGCPTMSRDRRPEPCATRPHPVDGGHRFRMISAGGSYTCGVTTEGRALCWGTNYAGQLGVGDALARRLPTPVAGNRLYREVRAGSGHSCGITTGGEAFCWGSNAFGQVGDGSRDNRAAPVAVAGGLRFATLSLGFRHTCALTEPGWAHCWGANDFGQLGIHAMQPTSSPNPLPVQHPDG